MKTCTLCEKEKNLSEFYTDKGKPVSRCKDCLRPIAKQSSSLRRKRSPDEIRNSYLKHYYNKTSEWYEARLERQGWHCALCPRTDPGGKSQKWFCVDHDHRCCPGKKSCGNCVRGLLCAMCNTRLGWVENNTTNLKNYLEFGAISPDTGV